MVTTVDDILARHGLITLTPELVERSREHEVHGISEVTGRGEPQVARGALVYVARHQWPDVVTPATLAQRIRSGGGVAVLVDNDDLGLPPEFVHDCLRSSLPVFVLPRTTTVDEIRSAVGPAPSDRAIQDATDVSEIQKLLGRHAEDTGTEVWLALSGCLIPGTPGMRPAARVIDVIGSEPSKLSGAALQGVSLRIEVAPGTSVVILNPHRRKLSRRSVDSLVRAVAAWRRALQVRRSARASIEAALIRELVQANAPSATLDPWVRSFGFTTGARVRAIVLVVDEHESAPAFLVDALHDVAVNAGTRCVAGVHGPCAYALVEWEASDTADAGEAFEDSLAGLARLFAARDGLTVNVGFSSCVLQSADDLVRGFISGRQLAERTARKVNAPLDRLPLPPTTAGALLAGDPTARDTLIRTLLVPVEDYDARRGTQYLGTLRTFLALDGHFGATANELGIHINTLRYRLSRIENLSGRGLATTGDRSDYYLALCLRESMLPESPNRG